MADLSSEIFAAVLARYTADTGASGINETGGTNRVRHFVRRGDPNFDDIRTHNWPMIVVDIFNTEDRFFGQRHANCFVRMHLYTNRDENTSSFTSQNNIASKIYDLYDGYQLATQNSTQFSLLNQLRDFQGPVSGTELHRVFEFSVHPVVTNVA